MSGQSTCSSFLWPAYHRQADFHTLYHNRALDAGVVVQIGWLSTIHVDLYLRALSASVLVRTSYFNACRLSIVAAPLYSPTSANLRSIGMSLGPCNHWPTTIIINQLLNGPQFPKLTVAIWCLYNIIDTWRLLDSSPFLRQHVLVLPHDSMATLF